MIKRVTLIILFLPLMAMANSGSIPSGANFRGYIGNQKVKMVLINDNGDISGLYGKADHSQHDNYIKDKNYFEGRIENQQRLKLTVRRYNKNNHMILANIINDNGKLKLKGKWYSEENRQKARTRELNLEQYYISYKDYRISDQHIYRTSSKQCYEVALHYPKILNPQSDTAAQKFNQEIDEFIKNNLRLRAKEAASNNNESQSPDNRSTNCKESTKNILEIDYVITHFQNNALSVRLNVYHRPPRSHLLTWFKPYNYDLKRARFITLDKLFKPHTDYKQHLAKQIRSILNNQLSGKKAAQKTIERQVRALLPKKAHKPLWNLRPDGILFYGNHDSDILVPAKPIRSLLAPDYQNLFTSDTNHKQVSN